MPLRFYEEEEVELERPGMAVPPAPNAGGVSLGPAKSSPEMDIMN